jgi:hypothetical protein
MEVNFMKKFRNVLSFRMLLILVSGISFGTTAFADCPDGEMKCWGENPYTGEYNLLCGTITIGTCYKVLDMACLPCNDDPCSYRKNCNAKSPDCCGRDGCSTSYKAWQGATRRCGYGDWKPPYW